MRHLREYCYATLALIGLIGGTICLAIFLGFEAPGVPRETLEAALIAAFSHPLVAGIALDAVVAGAAFLVWLIAEARSLSMRRWWIYVVLLFATPLAFAFPFFLFMRERTIGRAS